VTNLWHESVRLADLQRHVLRHLDGRHDRAALTDTLCSEVHRGKLAVQDAGRPVKDEERIRQIVSGILDDNLRDIARKGLPLPADIAVHNVYPRLNPRPLSNPRVMDIVRDFR
jgi:hypothetical protein